jgi:uncharacterized membrane protein
MFVKKKELIKKNKGVIKNLTHPSYFLPVKFGERSADNVAKYAGSWKFIIGFIIFLLLWMGANVYAWLNTWDPYPFILLNLVLSCIAALQAPVILMSQNRAADKARQRAEYDYAVNRKAEREIQEIRKLVKRIDRKIK